MTWLQPIHEAFLEKYEPDINLKVNVAFQDYHEREDAKQEMRVELIKSYKSRDKHADWHNIVRGIINRRIIDYRKRLYRTPLVNMPNHRDNGDDFMAHIIENKIAEGQEVDSDFTDSVETADFLDNVLSVYANAEDEFDEWEQEYVEVLYHV
jgi:DNA-directed RNA polymerase specialized sigma24 family protein